VRLSCVVVRQVLAQHPPQVNNIAATVIGDAACVARFVTRDRFAAYNGAAQSRSRRATARPSGCRCAGTGASTTPSTPVRLLQLESRARRRAGQGWVSADSVSTSTFNPATYPRQCEELQSVIVRIAKGKPGAVCCVNYATVPDSEFVETLLPLLKLGAVRAGEG